MVGAVPVLVGLGPADPHSSSRSEFGGFDVRPFEGEEFACPEGGVIGDGDHGDVEVAAGSGLFGGLKPSAGPVSAGFVCGEGDLVDVVLAQGLGLPGCAAFSGGDSVEACEHGADVGVVGRVVGAEVGVVPGEGGAVGAQCARFQTLGVECGQPGLYVGGGCGQALDTVGFGPASPVVPRAGVGLSGGGGQAGGFGCGDPASDVDVGVGVFHERSHSRPPRHTPSPRGQRSG